MEDTRRFAVWVEVRNGVTVVSKQGWGPVASAALQREAAVLDALRHPGIVDLVSFAPAPPPADGRARLCTRFAGAHTLLSAPPASPALHVLRAGQLLATLAALHARGLAHGAIDAAHVVVGPSGSARWCGLGSAGPAPAGTLADETLAAADLAVRALSAARLPRRRLSPQGRAERHLVDATTAILTDGRLDAAGLTSALACLLPPSGSPSVDPPEAFTAVGRRPRWPAIGRRR